MRKKHQFLEEKSVSELNKLIVEKKENLLTFRMQHARGLLKSPVVMRETRKMIARVNTLLTLRKRSEK